MFIRVMMIECNYQIIGDDWTLQDRHSGWHQNEHFNEMHNVYSIMVSFTILSWTFSAYSIIFPWDMFL